MKDDAKKLKLIIADDHPLFREGMVSALQSLSVASKIAEASNGQEVIELLGQEHYDIVLMDIGMKGMGGIEATGIVSKKFPRTKVIAISMHDEVKIINEILNQGAVGYLVKNSSREEIRAAIEDVQAGKAFYSHEVSRLLIEDKNNNTGSIPDFVKEDSFRQEKFKEILFLICHDCSNDDMAHILCLSKRTVEDYRKEIRQLTGQTKLFGLFKYAIDKGILEDVELKKKFVKYLSKKK
jgi:DNA-binding NarL/FixJ family response regulator